MEAILKFDLENPEDKAAHTRACNADKYLSALYDFKDFLRSQKKYTELSEEQRDYLDKITDRFFEITENIDFEEVWF